MEQEQNTRVKSDVPAEAAASEKAAVSVKNAEPANDAGNGKNPEAAAPRKKRFGDRRDGRKVRSLDPMMYVGAVVMPKRNDALNFFEYNVDMAPIEKYINRKRHEEGMRGFGFMHVVTAGFVRMISQRPAMNRYIAGNKIFQRDEIVFSMMVKKSMTADGQETGIKLRFKPDETIYDVYKEMNEAIEAAKAEGDSTALDKVARAIVKMPALILRMFVGLMNCLDYFGIMPKVIEEASPFHASFFFSNLGSLGIPPVYHHIYNFGNVSTFLVFGSKEIGYELDDDGNVVKKRFVRCRVVTDERITDGFYMASSFKVLMRILKHPEVLDNPPDQVFEDVE